MAAIVRYEFTVEGTYDFPYDMLRYDQCWPKAEASKLGLPRRGEMDKPRQVTLYSLGAPTEARWSSFGWRVVSQKKHTTR